MDKQRLSAMRAVLDMWHKEIELGRNPDQVHLKWKLEDCSSECTFQISLLKERENDSKSS